MLRGADVATGAPWPSISEQDVLICDMPWVRTRRRRERGPRSRSVLGSSPWTARCKSRSSILSKRHGTMAWEVLHGALTRSKERTDDLLFAAARAPSLNVVKARAARRRGARARRRLIVQSDQYKTAAVVVLQERPGAVRRRRARARQGRAAATSAVERGAADPQAPPQGRASGQVEGFCRHGGRAPQSARRARRRAVGL